MLKIPNNPSSFEPQQPNSLQPPKGKGSSESKPNADNKSRLMDILADVMKTIMKEHGKLQNEELKKDSNISEKNPDFKRQGEEGAGQRKKPQVICISNKATIQKSKYGEQYKNNLDPRDRLLSHPFQFLLEISQIEDLDKSFTKSKIYNSLCQKIKEYLVDVVENVVSASFNLLIEGKLKENESKDYASKNILMNVYSIFKEVMQTLTEEEIINKKEAIRLRFALIQLVDDTLNQILSNLAPYYPQAPPTGGTPRMREALLSIDRNSNEELDFLYTQKLKLRESDDNDYTGYIMTVINRAIQVTGEIDHKDPLRQTLFQKFVAFSQNLFWVAQQDSYQDVIGSFDQESQENDKDTEQVDMGGEKQLRKPSNQQPQFLQSSEPNNGCSFCNSCSKGPEINIKKKGKEVTDSIGKKLISEYLRKPIFADSSKAILPKVLENNKQKKIQEMKATHEFQIGQKIPGSVKSFSKKDIVDKNFSAKHSAVLRMLTKWAQNLQNIFDNPEVYTLNRTYPFKTLTHQIIFPKKQLKQNLYNNLVKQKPKKEKIKDYLITRNKVFQSTFFSKDNTENISKLIKRYTETRMMASKINALLIQFMKQYVSQLIKLLVEAGKTKIQFTQGQYVIDKEYEINLVVFKIGDLMRSKIHCSEASFIRLLKTMYILEEVDTNREKSLFGEKIKKAPIFELVRIKNKLDTKDNNILINYLFMGKIQCELQMSVQKIAGKQMNYYMFSHFLYELTRGTFGVLSECATIIAQHDPIVSSSSANLYYEPKKQKKKVPIEIAAQRVSNPRESLELTSNVALRREGKKGSKMFVCQKCENLKFEQNLDLMQRESHENEVCNECLMVTVVPQMLESVLFNTPLQFKPEQKLNDREMSQWIIQNLKKSHIEKLNNYEQLLWKKDEKITYIIFSLNHKKIELQFSLFNYQQSENIFFLSRVTKEILQKENKKEKDVEYENITGQIKKAAKFPEYTYIMPISEEPACLDVLSRIKFIKSEHVVDKLNNISQKCRDKILRDSILTILRNRNQTLQFNSNEKKLSKMKELVEEGQMKDSKIKDSKNKWVEESLANIQFIFAEKTNMPKIPQWLGLCTKMQLINLSGNSIKDISPLQNMTEITEIILHENEIGDTNWKKLINLERLNLSNNKLKNFDMKTLPPSLEEIDLGDNGLKDLNLQNISRYLPKLKKLDVFGNDITTIDLRSLPATVQHIDVSFNFLKTIQYAKLPPSLQVLYLNHNEITSFHVQDLHSLHELVLSENKLTKFQIRNCPSLKELYLDQNVLTKIELNDFPVLLQLSIGENPNLSQLILKNLPSIHLISMGSINVKKLKDQMDHLGHDGVQIAENPEMVKYLQGKYPKIYFYNQQCSAQNGYILNESEHQNIQKG